MPTNNDTIQTYLYERYHFDQFKIGKDSTRRALQRLEQAGLIKLGKKGRKFIVCILPAKETVVV